MEIKIRSNPNTFEITEFRINGVKADVEDFGEICEMSTCHMFISGRKEMTQSQFLDILAKYYISEKEFEKVCDELYREIYWDNKIKHSSPR